MGDPRVSYGKILDEYEHRGELIKKWDKIKIKNYTIFYAPQMENEKNGFIFYVLEQITFSDEHPECNGYELIFHGIAYYDGIRHLYMGDEDEGYIYYPDLEDYVKIFQELIELSKKYCTEWH